MKRSEAPKPPQYEQAMSLTLGLASSMAEMAEVARDLNRILDKAQNRPEYGGESDGTINEKMWNDMRLLVNHVAHASRILVKLCEFEVARLKRKAKRG